MNPLLEILEKSTAYLQAKGCPTARLDAQVLLADALGMSRMDLYVHFERPLTVTEMDDIRERIARRARREPVAYILGCWEFRSIDFAVGPGVLVPRPDTETLVETALTFCSDEEVYIADIGAGSGCVGLSLAHKLEAAKVYATDTSAEALGYLRKNTLSLGLTQRVAILRGDLLEPIPAARPVDLVVSNPPYIPSATLDALEPEVATWEPRLALDGGADGLDVYRRLIPAAAMRARRAVITEIGHDQGDAVSALFAKTGLVNIERHKDLGGRDRVVSGRVP